MSMSAGKGRVMARWHSTGREYRLVLADIPILERLDHDAAGGERWMREDTGPRERVVLDGLVDLATRNEAVAESMTVMDGKRFG